MKFYLDTIEQLHGETEGTFNEYGKREIKANYNAALTAFYTKLMNVSNSADHVYMDIKIVNSEGGILKKDVIGSYTENA